MAECLILGSGDKSFDANASASDIISGKTAYVNGQKVTGNIPYRGTYEYAGGMGGGNDGTDYYAFNQAPEGCYRSENYEWAPELRLAKTKVREYLGVDASKIVAGKEIAGITGNSWNGVYKQASYEAISSSSTLNFYDVYGSTHNRKMPYVDIYPSGFSYIAFVAWLNLTTDACMGWMYDNKYINLSGGNASYGAGGYYSPAGSQILETNHIRIPNRIANAKTCVVVCGYSA